MQVYKRPLAVTHINSNFFDDRTQLINECIASLHMRTNEADLLRYYAECSNGFAPAAILIKNKLGLDEPHMRRARALLQEDGIITIIYGRILIDWSMIRLFASLKNEKAKNGTRAVAAQRRHRIIISPRLAALKLDNYISSLLLTQHNSYKHKRGLDILSYIRWPLIDLCKWLSTLSEEESQLYGDNIAKFYNDAEKKTGPIMYYNSDRFANKNYGEDDLVESKPEEFYLEEGWVISYDLPF